MISPFTRNQSPNGDTSHPTGDAHIRLLQRSQAGGDARLHIGGKYLPSGDIHLAPGEAHLSFGEQRFPLCATRRYTYGVPLAKSATSLTRANSFQPLRRRAASGLRRAGGESRGRTFLRPARRNPLAKQSVTCGAGVIPRPRPFFKPSDVATPKGSPTHAAHAQGCRRPSQRYLVSIHLDRSRSRSDVKSRQARRSGRFLRGESDRGGHRGWKNGAPGPRELSWDQ